MVSENNGPEFCLVTARPKRAFLTHLRDTVRPILAKEILPHFTDHSVVHSDTMAGYVDKLVGPMRQGKELGPTEAVVLYAFCYLHDIGMHYESIGETQTFARLSYDQNWNDLEEQTRRDILREHHHEISAELVQESCRSANPPIGMQLPQWAKPDCMASLCEAHCVDTEEERYSDLA